MSGRNNLLKNFKETVLSEAAAEAPGAVAAASGNLATANRQ